MTFTGTLLPYQNDAVDKMTDRQKVLVAYDLGLGKTVLTIAALERLRDLGDLDNPTLVVCLSSLKYQWAKEIAKFSDSSATVIDGSRLHREGQFARLSANPTDYVIVNYEQVVNDWDALTALEFSALVMDEATAIKSFRSKRSRKVKEISRSIPIRFALTGTPIENGRPEELYSIMQAVDTRVFSPRFDLFDQAFIVRNKFGGVERYRNLPKLHAKLQTASVRKSQTDPDVAPFLPDAIHKDPVMVPLDRYSARMYRIIADYLVTELEAIGITHGRNFSLDAHYGHGGAGNFPTEERGRIMSRISALRLLCDDPSMLVNSASRYDPMRVRTDEGSAFLHELLSDPKMLAIVQKAKTPKLDVLASLVADHLAEEENKVVVFTSFVDMAATICDRVGGVVYSGQLDAAEKESNKVAFQTDPDIRVLVSTDAGGYGVDLPQANLLINFDLPWSAGLAVQRNGRIKRASSRWPSIVIQDILAADTIEVRMYEVLRQKNSVAAAVVDGQGINTRGGVDMTAGNLMDFLREYEP